MPTPVTLAAMFATYREADIPANASAIQIEECRRAFYAGSYFMLTNLRARIGDDEVRDDDGGVQYLVRLHEECETFLAEQLDRSNG